MPCCYRNPWEGKAGVLQVEAQDPHLLQRLNWEKYPSEYYTYLLKNPIALIWLYSVTSNIQENWALVREENTKGLHNLTFFFTAKVINLSLLWMKGWRCELLGSTCRSLSHQFTSEGDNSHSLPLLLTGCSQSSICLFLKGSLKPFSSSLYDSQH